jgi:uncharacterized protein (DUF433 family)
MGDVISMLDRPVYQYAEVDRLLRLTSGTAKRWINGYRRDGRWYDPVIREATSDSAWVTWGEFTETRLLAEFRSSVPMIKLRPAVGWLRESFDTAYPLAYARPFLEPDGRELLLAAQRETGVEEELWLAVPSAQGALLTATSRRFIQSVHYADTTGPRPSEYVIADQATPEVVFHPQFRQGQPTVSGIRAETLAGLVAGGEPISFVASTYDLTADQVEQAVAYEASRRRAA